VSNGEFSGSSYRLTSVKLYDRPWLPWQRNLTQNWLGPITLPLPCHAPPVPPSLSNDLRPKAKASTKDHNFVPKDNPGATTTSLSLSLSSSLKALLPFRSFPLPSTRSGLAFACILVPVLFFYFVQQYNISFILFRCEEMTINI